jgi:hypothetical protein
LKVTEGCLPNNGVFSEFREEFGWLIDRAVLLYNTPFLKKKLNKYLIYDSSEIFFLQFAWLFNINTFK